MMTLQTEKVQQSHGDEIGRKCEINNDIVRHSDAALTPDLSLLEAIALHLPVAAK